jgi:membrane-associated protease RseP (regulator of RpoE activity)
MNGYLIALTIFLAYVGIVYLLNRMKWFQRHSMSLVGPMIMWKTRRGKAFIEKLASKKRFWNFYGMAALWICAGSMLLIMLLLLWEATIVPQIKRAPSPELILGIPGINPVIPLGYGILALVIAIVVHEFAHGILTRVGDVKVQSIGIVLMVIPIGAFVEPDEKELQATTRSRRSKVFAVGPATNIILAMVVLAIFSGVMMSSVQATHDGALTLGVVDGSPAAQAGLTPSCVIVSIDGVAVRNGTDFAARMSDAPGSNISVGYYFKGQLKSTQFTDGVVIAYAAKDFAAYDTGLETGMVLLSINDTRIGNVTALADAMELAHAGQTVDISVMSLSPSGVFVKNSSISQITLSDKWEYYQEYDPSNNDPSYHGVAYLGGGFLDLGLRVENVSYYSDVLANPFAGDGNLNDFSRSWLRLIALPFLDLAPIRSPVTDLYHPSGGLSWMPDSAFWLVTNSLYWVFWLNLMIGLTNVLPAVPLDGGYIFRDAIDFLLSKTGKTYTKEQKDRVVGSIVLGFALLVLALIVWQIVGPAL